LAHPEQQLIDRGEPADREPAEAARAGVFAPSAGFAGTTDAAAERAARATLRSQIARLEGELSRIVTAGFPNIAPIPLELGPASGPTLLGMAQLERQRDRLAARVQQLTRLAGARAAHERRAREQLRRMKLEPGRYRFVRLPVSELGEGGCGVWEVRPRYGLIGMLAGWWQLKLSSGCPLPRGSRSTRDPGRQSAASSRARCADARSATRSASSPTSGSATGTCGSGSGPSGAGS
jgi:hypothetical protein